MTIPYVNKNKYFAGNKVKVSNLTESVKKKVKMPEIEIIGDTEMQSGCGDEKEFIDLEHYRKIVKSFIDMRQYKTALFWAEKVVILSKGRPKDIYWLAQCMFSLGEYNRAAHVIKFWKLEKTNLWCHCLCAESLYEAKQYQEALDLLNAVEPEELSLSVIATENKQNETVANDEASRNELLATLFLLKGKILEALDNRVIAMECYMAALTKCVYCIEALDALVQHEMLLSWEENAVMKHLPFAQQCSEADERIIKKLFETKLKKYYDSQATSSSKTPNERDSNNQKFLDSVKKLNDEHNFLMKVISSTDKLTPPPAHKFLMELKNSPAYCIQSSLSKMSMTTDSNKTTDTITRPVPVSGDLETAMSLKDSLSLIEKSIDWRATVAEKLFYNYDFKQTIMILEQILKEDPFHTPTLTVLIGALCETKDFNRLFQLAHKLVELYPDNAISWHAVGCYYDLIGKNDPARRYLSKATSLDRSYGPAWLAYGHSFAKENEHDQAMAAYFKATQLMRGCHLPLLYIGIECGLTKNMSLARDFFEQVIAIAPLDVHVLHEIGVLEYEQERFKAAEDIFRLTLSQVQLQVGNIKEAISPRWEPLINNLAHCCRKNKKYADALEFHRLSLFLKPQNANTYTAIGFVQALNGDLENAIKNFHKSLALKRDDVITSSILKLCIEDLVEVSSLPKALSTEATENEMDTTPLNITEKASQSDSVDMSIG